MIRFRSFEDWNVIFDYIFRCFQQGKQINRLNSETFYSTNRYIDYNTILCLGGFCSSAMPLLPPVCSNADELHAPGKLKLIDIEEWPDSTGPWLGYWLIKFVKTKIEIILRLLVPCLDWNHLRHVLFLVFLQVHFTISTFLFFFLIFQVNSFQIDWSIQKQTFWEKTIEQPCFCSKWSHSYSTSVSSSFL